MRIRLGVFGSGSGTTAQALYQWSRNAYASYKIVCVVSNKVNVGIIQKAQQWQLPYFIYKKENLEALIHWLNEQKVQGIVLAGFLKKIPPLLLKHFPIINIHPSLLPAFGGKGMYGKHVHEAVAKSRLALSGFTIHQVNEEYDAGPILFQYATAVIPGNAEAIEKKVRQLERWYFPLWLDSWCRKQKLSHLHKTTP